MFQTLLLLLCLCSTLSALTWTTPEQLSTDGQNATFAQIAVDFNGDAVAVWQRPNDNGTYTLIQASIYTKATNSWSTTPVDISLDPSETVEAQEGLNAVEPQVAVDTTGDAIAVWRRFNGSFYIVQAALYTKSTNTWAVPIDLSVDGQSALQPQISIGSGNDAIVIWRRLNPTNNLYLLQGSAYTKTTNTWATPDNISTFGQNSANGQVDVNAVGDTISVWQQSNGQNVVIQSSTTTL